ncbi:Membrane protein YdfJ [compost metagenome]
MGTFLHKLGEYAFRHKWLVLSGWLAALAVLAVLAVSFMKPTTTAISIPGTPAQHALDRMSKLFPDAGAGSGRVVLEAPTGKTIADFKPQIDTMLNDIARLDGVSAVVSPFENTRAISDDKTIAYAQLQLRVSTGNVPKELVSGIEKTTADARKNGLVVETGGDVIDKAPGEILGLGEVGGVAIALIVLVLALGALVAAGMPIVIAIITIAISMAGLFSLSQVIEIGATTPVLAVMLGLAVGIDYSLFIISKYRSYLLEGFGYKEAAGKSIATAGNAVLFAAATVVIALSALAVVQIPFMTTMGLAGAATVALAAFVAVTLVPALLGMAGDKIFRGKTKKAIEKAQAAGPHDSHKVSHETIWYKWGAAITKHPVIVLVVAALAVAAIALPAKDLKLGLPGDQYASAETSQKKAYELLNKGFGPGFNGPLLLVVDGVPKVSDADRARVEKAVMGEYQKLVIAETARQAAAFEQRAASAATPAELAQLQQDMQSAQSNAAAQKEAGLKQAKSQIEQYGNLYQLSKISDEVAKLGTVAQALPAAITTDGQGGLIQVIPRSAPADTSTLDLIAYLRSKDNQLSLASGNQNVSMGITGTTALESDINKKLSDALPMYLAVVVGLSLVLLIIAFRSILVPIKATLGFLLSVLAMFGALVAVFQWGWFGLAEAPGPIVSFIPIIAIGILFGLAMDYEFFLVSSMHEAYGRSGNAKKAVVDGFALGSKVVTAAGVIMVAVFAGFIFNHDATIQAIGFGLGLGILVDAFIVRMTIVPAVMTLLGKSAWWLPKWLDRIVPHVSIEGEEEPLKRRS